MTKYVSFNENQISGVKKQTKLKGGRRLMLAGSRDVKSRGKHVRILVFIWWWWLCVCAERF